jgi:hypothetical protein
VNFKFIEWFGAISLPPRRTRLTTPPFAHRTSRSANFIRWLSSEDGFEEGILETLVDVYRRGKDIAVILEDL